MKYKYFLAILALTSSLLVGSIATWPDQNLHLIFCDVGQGDAILAIKGETQILIDGGSSSQVLNCLSKHLPFWDRTLEMVILTHPDYDHLTGLVDVIQRYSVKQLTVNSVVVDTGVFSKFRSEVIVKKIPVFSPKNGDKIKLGKLTLNFLYPEEKIGDELVWQTEKNNNQTQVLGTASSTNEKAIVFELDFEKFKALLTGDIGEEQEKEIEPELADIDVLKIAHHGSQYSTSQGFLETTKPELAVISVGASNKYGHPAPETLERLKSLGIKTERTDIDGEVEVITDGQTWSLKN